MKRTSKLARIPVQAVTAIALFIVIAGLIPVSPQIPTDLKALLDRLTYRQKERPEDKVYLHLDRPMYQPGETLWFTAYVREGASLSASAMSDVLHVELIDPKGSVAQQASLVVKKGIAQGQFALDGSAPGGMYRIRAYTRWMKNDANPAFFDKEVQVQAVVTPRIKMKLDFVREAYGPGAIAEADITFESLTNLPIADREVLFQLKVKGVSVKDGRAKTDAEGKVRISVPLPSDLDSPDALLLVMMNHQGILESISRSVPVVLKQVDLTFYPEGGDLVAGLPGKVAFRALNAYGEAADVAGVILDSDDEVVARFSSYHKGMGACEFTPKAGEKYRAALSEPFVTDPIYDLPRALPRGYALQVLAVNEKVAKFRISSTETETATLVATVRGTAYQVQDIALTGGSQEVEIPIENLPMGVAQWTLFDARSIPRAERLSFVHRQRQMKVEISTDKDKYLPREQVTVNIRTTDDRGLPLPAQVSMAVVDDRLRSFADDRSSTILSWLLVESDLAEEVEDPRFYFDPAEQKAPLALDYLLMTSGWRRFTWRALSEEIGLPPMTHAPEQTRIMGRLDDENGEPIAGATVEAPQNMVVRTGPGGHFEFRHIDLYEPVDLILTIPGQSQKYTYRVSEYRDDVNIQIGVVRGKVTDTEGQPIFGANVMVAGTRTGALTNENGRFEIRGVAIKGSNQILRASMAGYESQDLLLADGRNEQGEYHFTLGNQMIFLQEMVVQAGAVRHRAERRDERPMMAAPMMAPMPEEEPQIADFMMADAVPAPGGPADMEVEDLQAGEAMDDDMPMGKAMAEQWAFNAGREPVALNLGEVKGRVQIPASTLAANAGGTVVTRVLVDANGKVNQVQLVRSVHPDLDMAVMDAVRGLRFQTEGQAAGAYWINIPMEFRPEQLARRGTIFVGSTPNQVALTRVREFAAPSYVQRTMPKRRTDFRNTLHWAGAIETDRRGEASISFYTSDALTSFHITVEGIGMGGVAGRGEHRFFSQLPVEIDLRLPAVLTAHDKVMVPLTVINNTGETIESALSIRYPRNLRPLETLPEALNLKPKEARTLLIPCVVDTLLVLDSLEVDVRAYGFADAMVIPVRNEARGFPASAAFTSEKNEATFDVDLRHAVPGSVKLGFTAFPSVSGEIMEGLEGMLREPYGCFEQTSSTTYPNVLVLTYLRETEQDRPEISKRALDLIKTGYSRLTGFESPSGGFEWFGGDPGHEGLTAYGLMEFVDMAKVYDGVSQEMLDRTTKWLLARRDGKGGFERNPRALHEFGLSDQATNSLYIAYALSEAGHRDLSKEAGFAYETAKASKDAYQLGLAANLLLNLGDAQRGRELLSLLTAKQEEAGVWGEGLVKRSAPGSGGESLLIESSSLALMAMLKIRDYDRKVVEKAANWLRSKRSAYGSFGNTHSTVLALRALIDFNRHAKMAGFDGTVEVFAGNKLIGKQSFLATDRDAIVLQGLETQLALQQYPLRVRFQGGEKPLPYTLSLTYATNLPPSADACPVALKTTFAATQVKMGETLRMNVELRNKTSEGQPMTMAIVGIPGGLSAQPWQLKEMLDRKEVDFYEINGQDLVLYYRQMAPGEKRTLAFDLKAEVPGTFQAQASRAYLYYTAENRHWVQVPEVVVAR